MKYFGLFFLLVCFTQNILCQSKRNLPQNANKIIFETSAYGGKIFKHNSKFLPDITEPSFGFEISAGFKTFGKKNWQHALNFPEIGISYVQSHFGDKDIFGSAYGLLPYAKFYITRSKIVDFYARMGGGLAYITKPFDIVNNPTNNVIGSKINTIVQFRLGLDFHLSQQFDLVLAGSFMHYSNSKSQAPNLGINIPMASVGLRYMPNAFKQEFIQEKNTEDFRKKNEYSFRFSLGFQEMHQRGSKFPVYSLALQYARYFGYANKILAGTIVSFNQVEYDFRLLEEAEQTDNLILSAMDWSVYGGYEILLGKVGVNILIGAYLIDYKNSIPIYAKPGITYYFLEFGKQKHKPFIGVNMKTHYFVAQYVEMHFGIAF